MTFDTDGLTLIEWYIWKLPKYIEKHKDDPQYRNQIIEAQSILKLLSELDLMRDGEATISRPCEENKESFSSP